ncbi:MAG: DUF2892 domain-containing protein [Methylibium sp.]|nr:DUF2892 domain-containing protein [Methylibium sp.]MBA3623099.1 DUF2892 domain-containing protein [Methylibium sp.]
MQVNVGTLDRAMRIVAGLALIGLAFAGHIGPRGYYIGVVPLATALLRTCPAYTLLGIDTCSSGRR